MSLLSLDNVSILVEGLDHAEGVAWGPDGNIYAGGEAGQIYRITPSGEITEIANTGGSLLGICLDGSADIYACDFKRQAVLHIDELGSVSVYSDGADGRKMIQPNFPVFDRQGNLYVSDSGDWRKKNGCIFRIAPNGDCRVASMETDAFPNGMAIHPEGSFLYVVLSNLPGVVKLSLSEDGIAGPPQPVVELPGTVPDGLAFDANGTLYISCYAPDAIYRLSGTGDLAVLVKDQERTLLSSPTNIAFIGEDRSILVAANYGGWHLSQLKPGSAGASLHYPLVSAS